MVKMSSFYTSRLFIPHTSFSTNQLSTNFLQMKILCYGLQFTLKSQLRGQLLANNLICWTVWFVSKYNSVINFIGTNKITVLKSMAKPIELKYQQPCTRWSFLHSHVGINVTVPMLQVFQGTKQCLQVCSGLLVFYLFRKTFKHKILFKKLEFINH